MATHSATDIKNAVALGRYTAWASRPQPLTLSLYTGTQPEAGSAITTQTLLISIPFFQPFATISGSNITFRLHSDAEAVATGVISWGRITDYDGVWILDASANSVDGFFLCDTAMIEEGNNIVILSATRSEV